MTNILFVCSQNQLSSPTAAAIFAEVEGWNVRSAGTDKDAVRTLTKEDVEWADTIVTMELEHKLKIRKNFWHSLKERRQVCFGIPDDYEFMDGKLIEVLKSYAEKYLDLAAPKN